MASSEKTQRLGLSLWEETDRPERLDFRQDNEKLEELVGRHLASAALHLETTEKNFLREPVYRTTYTGNNAERRSFDYPYGMQPKIILVFAKGTPFFLPRDGRMDFFAAMGYYRQESTIGMSCFNQYYTMFQEPESTAASTGCRGCLNETGKTYTVLMVR